MFMLNFYVRYLKYLYCTADLCRTFCYNRTGGNGNYRSSHHQRCDYFIFFFHIFIILFLVK